MRVDVGVTDGGEDGEAMERMEDGGGEGAGGKEVVVGSEVRRSTMSVVPRVRTAWMD